MSEVELREVELPVGRGGVRPAALALPAAEEPRPGVLVLHELWGLNDDIRAIARRLAGEGYVALAPELYGPGRAPGARSGQRPSGGPRPGPRAGMGGDETC